MATVETLPATPSNRARPSVAAPPRTEPPEFPGCKPVHLPRAEIERFEGRLEYWEAATETAWICEPTTSYHERPARLLTRLAEVIARVRGSHIECYGSMDLLLRDERGEPQRIMQADESLYLHPTRAVASWRCTSRGDSRKCGWTCRTRRRRAVRERGDRG